MIKRLYLLTERVNSIFVERELTKLPEAGYVARSFDFVLVKVQATNRKQDRRAGLIKIDSSQKCVGKDKHRAFIFTRPFQINSAFPITDLRFSFSPQQHENENVTSMIQLRLKNDVSIAQSAQQHQSKLEGMAQIVPKEFFAAC